MQKERKHSNLKFNFFMNIRNCFELWLFLYFIRIFFLIFRINYNNCFFDSIFFFFHCICSALNSLKANSSIYFGLSFFSLGFIIFILTLINFQTISKNIGNFRSIDQEKEIGVLIHFIIHLWCPQINFLSCPKKRAKPAEVLF